MDRTKRLGEAPIFSLIIRFSIPSIISMTVNALYNIIDRIFIGQYVGEDALGGLTVAFPVMMVMFAVIGLFAIGSAALISIRFGEHDLNDANHIYGNLATLVAASSLLMMVFGQIFLPQLLALVGATPALLPHAQQYMRIILIGLLFQSSSFTLAALVRTEGKPNLAMASQLVAAGVNIVLDFLFIGIFGLGVRGAAIATVIGQFTGFLMLFWHFFVSKKSTLKLHIQNLKLKWKTVFRICQIGGSTFVINVGTSVATAIMNVSLKTYGGEAALASMGAIHSMVVVVLMPILGLQQGIGPIIGYNHGMRQKDRVRKSFLTGLLLSSSFAVIMFALMQFFPYLIASSFFLQGSPTIAVFVPALRIQALFLLLLPMTVMLTAFFQSTAQGGKGLFLSISRQALLVVAVIVLPLFWQLNGVWASAFVAELIACALGFLLFAARGRKDRPLQFAGSDPH